MNTYTSEGLVKYCKEMLNSNTVYMWGGLMNPTTKEFMNRKINQYKSRYKQSRINYLLKNWANKGYASDCVGLIKSYYFGGIGSPKYEAKKDLNTAGFYNVSKIKGSIKTLPEEPGVIVYMSGHVGVYIGKGKVIECTLGKYGDGVVETNLVGRGWTHWLKLPYISYGKNTITEPITPDTYGTYKVKKGDSLWKIASELLGSGTKYIDIARLNNISSPYVLKIGQVLKIPK